ncbi:MAG TPA: PilN domain-containing protein [Syntrophorhabdaceae bacterium]|nr:PilN domain-containing protein [Syntrophorhabdaceae bacterium]HQG79099.1 PilN domain-containing protein [bacterium]HOF58404.1 PilN domain-containing protein [Syntrophorhabdaceae bacterium]HOS06265.1 PilN domain-containing protein [Syntrophorhabdaceae bacterium]HPL41681.1 PilN domain-containing protein [Syntrophorhabdaceae bacterium]
MIRINLLPSKPKKDLFKHDIYMFFCLLLLAIFVFAGIYYYNVQEIKKRNTMIEKTKKEIQSLQHIYREYLAMEQEKKEIQRRIKAIDSIKEGRALAARTLYDISGIVKDNVWIKSFKKMSDKFELEGRSLENESISDLVEAISKIPYIRNVELKSVNVATEDGITVKSFTIYGDISL